MRAIIIEESRFEDLTAALQTTCSTEQFTRHPAIEHIPIKDWEWIVDDLHKKFRKDVVDWARNHGANII